MTQRSLADWLAHIERQHPKSIDLGLDRVSIVAQRMGLARPAARVITVAGTNGKGSTVAFIEAIGRAAGWRVGAYTSPPTTSGCVSTAPMPTTRRWWRGSKRSMPRAARSS